MIRTNTSMLRKMRENNPHIDELVKTYSVHDDNCHTSPIDIIFNKVGYTAKKQSQQQGRYTEGQGQSISGQGLYFGWAGAVMLRNHKYGQFRGIRNFA